MNSSYEQFVSTLPKHLRHFCVDQNYAKYTSENQATWRYIMRQHLRYLSQHAHPFYREGLKKTGVSIETIPRIEEMNEKLGDLGWGAVVVDGFVPPSIFMEFNGRKILPIAADIRTFEHTLYTPAPDIVHEAAGHAPFLGEEKYAQYLQKIGEYGALALFHQKDFAVYEAIRWLSMIKERPDATDEEIKAAEANLAQRVEENNVVSEATRISRLHWWTVEYGLVGELSDPKLYGAGLLSSLGESRTCLGDQVQKLPLSLKCTEFSYDVTRPQPQLFVARDWEHLFEVLEELVQQMAFRRGGVYGVEEAIHCGTWATAQLNSGLQISGVFSDLLKDHKGEVAYLKTTGPTGLAWKNQEIVGQGGDYHREGFGTAVGRFSAQNLEKGKMARLDFTSGVKVEGRLQEVTQIDGKDVILSFTQCQVTGPQGQTLFRPEWGTYDMALGEQVVSVFAGPADRERYHHLFKQSELKTQQVQYLPEQLELHALYEEVRSMRNQKNWDSQRIGKIAENIFQHYPENWLVALEILELMELVKVVDQDQLKIQLKNFLTELSSRSAELKQLISSGLAGLQE